MIAVIDYGVGNLFSLTASLNYLGIENEVTADCKRLDAASAIILPGVGAFADAVAKLKAGGLDGALDAQVRAGKPVLGICLGMQMLFERSLEYGDHRGLGYIPGVVAPIAERLPAGAKVPHMGWNALQFTGSSPLYKYLSGGEYVYFVHSYHATGCGDFATATAEYCGAALTASAERGNVYGTQFHPEKSGATGLKILRAFSEIK